MVVGATHGSGASFEGIGVKGDEDRSGEGGCPWFLACCHLVKDQEMVGFLHSEGSLTGQVVCG